MAGKTVQIDEDALIEQWSSGQHTVNELAKTFGVSGETVRNRLRARGLYTDATKGAKQPRVYVAIDPEELRTLWRSGEWSGKALAARFNTSEQTINAHLKRIGESRASGGKMATGYQATARLDAEIERVIQLYTQEKYSAREIANEYGCGQDAVEERLRARGVALDHYGLSSSRERVTRTVYREDGAHVEEVRRGVEQIDESDLKTRWLSARWTVVDLAKYYRVDGKLLSARLRQMGFDPQNPPLASGLSDEMVELLYRRGDSPAKIARTYFISPGAVRRRLRKMGYINL